MAYEEVKPPKNATQPKGPNISIEQEHGEKGEMERGRMNHNKLAFSGLKSRWEKRSLGHQ